VPGVLARVRAGADVVGGIVGHRLETLFEEVAFVAYHFHWPLADVLDLEHADRRRWVQEISSINRRMSEAAT
jgi:hypothetical protein